MRLLLVVQRYGVDLGGGAELTSRLFGERLARRGHGVEVLTSRARSYVDWADELPAGPAVERGVTVHRLGVRAPRRPAAFEPLNTRVGSPGPPPPVSLQRRWMEEQGPVLDALEPWLAAHAHRYDVAVFFTYLYATTWCGLPAARKAGLATVFHPTAHDEPALGLPLYDHVFASADRFGFFTEEEEALVRRRFRVRAPGAVLGIGQDLDVSGDATAFRRRVGLGDEPYLLYVGRLDRGKGVPELFDFFTIYKARRPGPLRLVLVGDPVLALPLHPEVIVTGLVDDATKEAALAGATALVQPSYFESFSMILTEAWAHRLPVLVQGRCAVLAGQARRSGGGLPYAGYAEFEAALDRLAGDAGLRDRLARAGRRYVEERYEWERLLDRYEDLLAGTARR